jgi:hypothetical protein
MGDYMRPNWFRCETCLFGVKIDEDGAPGIECNISNGTDFKLLTDFCKEWICANCWNSWDTCDYPDTKKDWVGIYHDHNKCEKVKFRGE